MARERKFTTQDLYEATEELLLKHSYEGFNFSLLAEHLHISRGAIYKYFENKEGLIAEYMVSEMSLFLTDLNEIESMHGFEAQFDFLINLMFRKSQIQQLIEMGKHIPFKANNKVKENKGKLENLHLEMYHNLHNFIQNGKKEQKLKSSIPDQLILGYIFQSVAIPNHFGIPHTEWVAAIKEIICHGILENN